MAFMFLLAMLLNLLFTLTLADIALGRYLDARLATAPQLILPNGSIPNGAFIRGTDGVLRRPNGTIPDGTSMQPEMRIPFVNPPYNGDVILFRDEAHELIPKKPEPNLWRDSDDRLTITAGQEARIYDRWTDTQQNRGWYRVNGWWHYAWNGHALPILAPSGR